jgi:hypothetical protein
LKSGLAGRSRQKGIGDPAGHAGPIGQVRPIGRATRKKITETTMLELLLAVASVLLGGIEAAFVPANDGGVDCLVRVEPDLVQSSSPPTLSSDVPADARDVRSVRIYVADAWPPGIERSVAAAARMPRPVAALPVAATLAGGGGAGASTGTAAGAERPWSWLVGALVALFLSLGANVYLTMLLGQMRSRFLESVDESLAAG